MATPANVFDRLAADYEARAQLVRDTVHELETNPAYQPYFAGYTPGSVAAFIQQYAERKARYVFDGPTRARHFEAESLEVMERAQARLWDIQQKKLFDLQCQWRAGQFRHPAIHVTDQFAYWERHPDRCPFLPPITPDEVALYLEYLAQPNCPEGDWSHYRRTPAWQDYGGLRSVYYEDELPLLPPDSHVFAAQDEVEEEEDEDDDNDDNDNGWDDEDDQPTYPAWYRFYDQRRGTGHLRHLRNERGMAQQYYEDLYFRNQWLRPAPASVSVEVPVAPVAPPAGELIETADELEDAIEAAPAPEPAAPPAPYVPDPRPWIHLEDDDTFRTIVERFDPTPQLLEWKRAQDQGLEERDSREADNTFFAVKNLTDSTLVIPIEEAAADWRPALRRAELLLRRQQLIRALPLAYDGYCQRQELGLAHTPPPLSAGWADEAEEPWNVNYARERVLKGRELAGEPLDFDF